MGFKPVLQALLALHILYDSLYRTHPLQVGFRLNLFVKMDITQVSAFKWLSASGQGLWSEDVKWFADVLL